MYDGTSRIYSMNFFSGKRNFATQSCNYVNKQIERAYSLREKVPVKRKLLSEVSDETLRN